MNVPCSKHSLPRWQMTSQLPGSHPTGMIEGSKDLEDDEDAIIDCDENTASGWTSPPKPPRSSLPGDDATADADDDDGKEQVGLIFSSSMK